MTVECVTVETNHLFAGNPLAEQHRLRHRAIIARQGWDVPTIRDLEYDQYDTPAATYLVWRDGAGIARGLARLCPTDRPFMLLDFFSSLVTYQPLPVGRKVLEGSRFCIEHTLHPSQRRHIGCELVVALLEFGVRFEIEQMIGVMYPTYWRNLFANNGWDPIYLGDPAPTCDGKKSRAALVSVSETVLHRVRAATGISWPVVSYGTQAADHLALAAPVLYGRRASRGGAALL